jgi:hypothetical protein
MEVSVQETNHYMQQDAQARCNILDIPYSQQISMRKLYEFLAIVAQMGYYRSVV